MKYFTDTAHVLIEFLTLEKFKEKRKIFSMCLFLFSLLILVRNIVSFLCCISLCSSFYILINEKEQEISLKEIDVFMDTKIAPCLSSEYTGRLKKRFSTVAQLSPHSINIENLSSSPIFRNLECKCVHSVLNNSHSNQNEISFSYREDTKKILFDNYPMGMMICEVVNKMVKIVYVNKFVLNVLNLSEEDKNSELIIISKLTQFEKCLEKKSRFNSRKSSTLYQNITDPYSNDNFTNISKYSNGEKLILVNSSNFTLKEEIFITNNSNENIDPFSRHSSNTFQKLHNYKLLTIENLSEERKKMLNTLYKNLKSQFLITISHELNNPLNGLLHYASKLLLREKEDLSISKRRKYIEKIKKFKFCIKFFIKNLTLFSKIILREKINFSPVNVSLGSLVKGILMKYEPFFDSKKIKYNSDITSLTNVVLFFDYEYLKFFLKNVFMYVCYKIEDNKNFRMTTELLKDKKVVRFNFFRQDSNKVIYKYTSMSAREIDYSFSDMTVENSVKTGEMLREIIDTLSTCLKIRTSHNDHKKLFFSFECDYIEVENNFDEDDVNEFSVDSGCKKECNIQQVHRIINFDSAIHRYSSIIRRRSSNTVIPIKKISSEKIANNLGSRFNPYPSKKNSKCDLNIRNEKPKLNILDKKQNLIEEKELPKPKNKFFLTESSRAEIDETGINKLKKVSFSTHKNKKEVSNKNLILFQNSPLTKLKNNLIDLKDKNDIFNDKHEIRENREINIPKINILKSDNSVERSPPHIITHKKLQKLNKSQKEKSNLGGQLSTLSIDYKYSRGENSDDSNRSIIQDEKERFSKIKSGESSILNSIDSKKTRKITIPLLSPHQLDLLFNRSHLYQKIQMQISPTRNREVTNISNISNNLRGIEQETEQIYTQKFFNFSNKNIPIKKNSDKTTKFNNYFNVKVTNNIYNSANSNYEKKISVKKFQNDLMHSHSEYLEDILLTPEMDHQSRFCKSNFLKPVQSYFFKNYNQGSSPSKKSGTRPPHRLKKKVTTIKKKFSSQKIIMENQDEEPKKKMTPIIRSHSLTCNCKKILIVDDEGFNITTMKHILKSYKIFPDFCFNGQEAINKVLDNLIKPCCGENYKLIFMDIMMPVLDGIEASLQIQKICQENNIDMNIVIISAHDSDVIYQRVKDIKIVKEFASKPIKKSKVDEILNKYFFDWI
jgi:CheY-like chemotaxis protein